MHNDDQTQNHLASNPLFWFGIGILFVIATYTFVSHFDNVQEKLDQAAASYLAGEQSETVANRKDAFNATLATYLSLEAEYSPQYGDGKLYYNIASTYFQLEEYPQSLYYFYRAANLMPRDEKASRALELTLQKLALNPQKNDSIFKNLLTFHHALSLPERLQLTLGFTLLSFFAWSCFIWMRKSWIKSAAFLLTLPLIALLTSLFYTQYLSPSEGVLTQSALLYRDAGLQYAKVSDTPLPAGTKVELLDFSGNGKWLKISTPEGTIGFIPYESLRVL